MEQSQYSNLNDNQYSKNEILWKGKPVFFPYFIHIVLFVVSGIVMIYMFYPASKEYFWALSPVMVVGIWLIVGLPIRRVLMFLNLEYIIQNDGIVIKTGIFKKEIIAVRFSDIFRIEMFDGIFDTISGRKSATICLYTSFTDKPYSEAGGNFTSLSHKEATTIQGYYSLISIPDAVEVKRLIDNIYSKTSHISESDVRGK